MSASPVLAMATPRPPSEPGAKEAFQIPSLDGIRAASFLVVFASHAGLQRLVPAHFGLTLFFFLSGYLITTLLRIEYDRSGTVSIRQFYLRRVLRIFPPFYLVLAVAAALTALGLLGSTLGFRALLAQACHLTNYYIIRHGWWVGMPPGTSVYWSLAVEEHFYLAFPLAFLFLRRRLSTPRQVAATLLGFCLAVLAWRFALVLLLQASRDRTYIATDTRIDAILFGCILALWKNPVLEPTLGDRQLAGAWLPLGAAAVLVSVVVRVPWFDQTLRYTLQSAGLLPFFVAAIRWHDRGPFRLFNLRPVRWVGSLTYSLYLMHFTALWALEVHTGWPVAVRALVALAGLLLAADLMFRFVEKPCGRLRRKLSGYLEGVLPRAAARPPQPAQGMGAIGSNVERTSRGLP